MFEINLLPEEFKKIDEKPRVVSFRFAMIVTSVLGILLWSSLSFMVGTIKVDLNNLSLQNQSLQTKSVEADKIISEINQNYLERNKVIFSINRFNQLWAFVFSGISNQLPETIWFEKIKLQMKGPNTWEFMLRGMAQASTDEPAIKIVGKYISSIKKVLESSIRLSYVYEGNDLGELNNLSEKISLETSTNQKNVEDVTVTEFKSWYLMLENEGSQDETRKR